MVLFTFPMWISHLRIWTMLFVRYVLSFLRWTEHPSTQWFAHSLAPTIVRMLSAYGFDSYPLLPWIYTRRWFPCSTPRPALYWNNKIVILLQLGCLKFSFRFEILMLFWTLALINASIFAFSLVFLFFCKDFVFKKHYNDSPEVLVCANHTTSGGNLNPLYNSISAWAEVRSYFNMKERFFNKWAS